jgi:hypothetical protein
VFPKVIANGTRDTIIQITNTSNSLVRAHCFYVNAALTDPSRPEDPRLNPRLWQEVDFDLILTKQQPTHWAVGLGRLVNPFDPVCGPGISHCNDAGFDPGRVPPVVPDFEGELKCVEVDESNAPLSGNHLKGEATLITKQGTTIVINGVPVPNNVNDVSKYNALAILGAENNGDGTLVLGGGQCVGDGGAHGAVCTSDDDCADAAPCAAEYNACPQTWILNHLAEDAPDPAIEVAGNGPSVVETELTVAPCTENFETQEPTAVTLQFLTINEFESQFSVSTTVTCWGNFRMKELGATALTFAGQHTDHLPLGTMFLQTRIRSANGTPFGVLMVGEEFHRDGSGNIAAAATNLHIEGERANPDIITIPDDQLTP